VLSHGSVWGDGVLESQHGLPDYWQNRVLGSPECVLPQREGLDQIPDAWLLGWRHNGLYVLQAFVGYGRLRGKVHRVPSIGWLSDCLPRSPQHPGVSPRLVRMPGLKPLTASVTRLDVFRANDIASYVFLPDT
jgi:hypothetical protein